MGGDALALLWVLDGAGPETGWLACAPTTGRPLVECGSRSTATEPFIGAVLRWWTDGDLGGDAAHLAPARQKTSLG